MGRVCFSTLYRWEDILSLYFYKMLHFFLLLSISSMAYSVPLTSCQTVVDSSLSTACIIEEEIVCTAEVDTIVDTTHVEDCQDVVTQVCQQVSQQVEQTSNIVGQNRQLLRSTIGKREAEAEADAEAEAEAGAEAGAEADPGIAYTSGPRCRSQTKRQCQQRPVQTSRQIPRKVCSSVPREVCTPVEVSVPRQLCQTAVPAVAAVGYSGIGGDGLLY